MTEGAAARRLTLRKENRDARRSFSNHRMYSVGTDLLVRSGEGNICVDNPRKAPNWWPLDSQNVFIYLSFFLYVSIFLSMFVVVELFVAAADVYVVRVLNRYYSIIPLVAFGIWLYRLRSSSLLVYVGRTSYYRRRQTDWRQFQFYQYPKRIFRRGSVS